jgi:hypothetical protein
VVVVLPWVPATATRCLKPHQLGQHLGAAHDRQPLLARGDELRVVALDRRRHHHHRAPAEIGGVVADEDRDALLAQPLGRWRCRWRRSPARV